MEDLANLQAHLTNLMLFGFGSLFAAFGGLGWFLNSRIDKVEARLNKRMDDMEANSKKDMEVMESRLNERMDGIESRQSERMDKLESNQASMIEKLDNLRDDVNWIKGVLYEREKLPGQVPYQLLPDRASQQEAAEVSEPAPEGHD